MESRIDPTNPLGARPRSGYSAVTMSDKAQLRKTRPLTDKLQEALGARNDNLEPSAERTLAQVKHSLGFDNLDAADEPSPETSAVANLPVHEATILAAVRQAMGFASEPVAFAHYRIIKRLGGGGMGVVHEAHDTELKRAVALKLLHPGGPTNSLLARDEGIAMAKVKHARVATVYEVGCEGGQAFIAMELVHGQPLDQWCKDHKPNLRTLIAMYAEIGRGLLAIHTQGVIHSDFKPSNVLVEALTAEEKTGELGQRLPYGKPKIIDFGMARNLGAEIRGGTPEYMAPELLVANPEATVASDQYAFCVALFEDLFNVHPYAGQTFEEFANTPAASTPRQRRRDYITEITRCIRIGEIRWPSKMRVPPWLQRALIGGLAFAPEDRFATMEPLVALLETSYLSARRKQRWLGIGATLGLGATIAAGAFAAWPDNRCRDLGDSPPRLPA